MRDCCPNARTCWLRATVPPHWRDSLSDQSNSATIFCALMVQNAFQTCIHVIQPIGKSCNLCGSSLKCTISSAYSKSNSLLPDQISVPRFRPYNRSISIVISKLGIEKAAKEDFSNESVVIIVFYFPRHLLPCALPVWRSTKFSSQRHKIRSSEPS